LVSVNFGKVMNVMLQANNHKWAFSLGVLLMKTVVNCFFLQTFQYLVLMILVLVASSKLITVE